MAPLSFNNHDHLVKAVPEGADASINQKVGAFNAVLDTDIYQDWELLIKPAIAANNNDTPHYHAKHFPAGDSFPLFTRPFAWFLGAVLFVALICAIVGSLVMAPASTPAPVPMAINATATATPTATATVTATPTATPTETATPTTGAGYGYIIREPAPAGLESTPTPTAAPATPTPPINNGSHGNPTQPPYNPQITLQ